MKRENSLAVRFENWMDELWERLFSLELSFLHRALLCSVIAIFSSAVTYVIYSSTAIYVSSITMLAVMLVALCCGSGLGVGCALILSLVNDYFFIPPLGSVLSDRESVEHFAFIGVVGMVAALVMASLRIAYKRITKVKQEAVVANRNKSNFLRTISHEIRTPLNGIIGLSDVLQKSGLNEEDTRLTKLIHESGKSLLKIINDILDYSKIESGKIELEISSFSIMDVAEQIVSTLSAKALEKNIHLDFIIDENVPRYLVGDSSRILQILYNLTGNAIKFTESGSVVLKIRLESAHEVNGVKLLFSVMDTGIGLDVDQQERLFQPFTQLQKVGTSGEAGTGLGLSICRQLLRMMGSDIFVESKKDGGSIFYFSLDFLEYSKETYGSVQSYKRVGQAEKRSEIVSIFESSGRPLVLVVEDNPTSQVTMQVILEQLGAQVIIASNGAESLDLIAKTKVDLIFMDCQMPVMDGYEATRKMRDRGVPLPIVAMTANVSEEDRKQCLEAGMDSFIGKPVTIDTLSAELSRLLKEGFRTSISDLALVRMESRMGKEVVTKVVNSFLSTLSDFNLHFELFIRNEDLKGIQRLGHKYRGAALTVGVEPFAQLCEQMENLKNLNAVAKLQRESLLMLPFITAFLKKYLNS
jgi:signal transduction histidine kinase/DNA-binding NarL/FixJ family response regulator